MKRLRKRLHPHVWRNDTIYIVRDGITVRIEERIMLAFVIRPADVT